MNAYTFDARGADGHTYGVGLVPHDAQQIVSMQDAADTLVAYFERQAPGVVVQ